jgi:hypothetical protein
MAPSHALGKDGIKGETGKRRKHRQSPFPSLPSIPLFSLSPSLSSCFHKNLISKKIHKEKFLFCHNWLKTLDLASPKNFLMAGGHLNIWVGEHLGITVKRSIP